MDSSTSILDSLVAPSAPPVQYNGQDIPTMRITPSTASPVSIPQKAGTSILDSLPPVEHPAQSSAPQPTWGGLSANLAAGANKSIFSGLGGPVDMATAALNAPIRGVNALAGTQIPQIENPVGGSDWINQQWQRLTGVNPQQVQPTTEAEHMAQAAGGAVATVPLMAMGGAAAAPGLSGVSRGVAQSLAESGGASLPRAGQIAAATGAGGAAGQAAEDAAPEPIKPIANLAGNLIGAGGVMGATEGLRAGGQIIAKKAGEMGIGPKQDIGGVQATGPQAAAAGQQVNQALGPEGRQIIERATGAEDEARELEAKLADPATPTVDRTVAQARLDEIQGRRVNLVPNSSPTTAQLAPTPGAVALEQAHRVATPVPFNERAGQQNNARVAAIQNVQPTGAPAAVGDLLRQRLNEIDQLGQQASTAAQGQVQQASGALGAQGTPAGYGEEIQGALSSAEKSRKSLETRVQQAIDPDGTLAIRTTPAIDAARAVRNQFDPRDWPGVDPKLRYWTEKLQGSNGIEAFSRFRQNWSDLSADMRTLSRQGEDPSTNTMRLLGHLKDGMKASIQTAGEEAAANDPAVANRLQAMGSENGPVIGVGSGQGNREGSSGPAPGVAGESGTEVNSSGRSGMQQGAGTVAPEAATASRLEPNVTPEKAAQIRAANASYADYKQTYRTGAIGRTIRPDRTETGFRVEEGSVPRQFLTNNAVEPARVQQYIEAVGGAPQAVAHMRDALVNDLREKGIVQSDGTIKSDAFNAWMQRRGQTIDQFPGLRGQLGTAKKAQEVLDQTTAAHLGAVKDFQNGVAKNFLHDEPIVAIRKAFASGNPTETFTQLTNLVRGKPDAEAGLKRAVVDFILEKASTTAPSGTSDQDFLKADTFRRWIRQNRAPLRVLFGGQGAQNLDMVAADLRRQSQRTAPTSGSDTAQKFAAVRKYGLAAQHGLGLTFLTLLGEHLGEMVHGGAGEIVGAVALPAMGYIAHSMKQAGINTINDLVREAMLHPELAKTLMERAPSQGIGRVAGQRIASGLQAAILADTASAAQRKDGQ